MKVIDGKFSKPDKPEPPTCEEVCTNFLDAAGELGLTEVLIIGRSDETGSIVFVSNQGVVDQNFLLDAAKMSMFQTLLVEA